MMEKEEDLGVWGSWEMFLDDRQVQCAQDIMCFGDKVEEGSGEGVRVCWEMRLEGETRPRHRGETRNAK